jgi:transcriptional regulator with XRE-family HTH domain
MKKDIRHQVGAWLRELRNRKGLTQEQVSERADVSPKYYSEVERGLRNITLLNLQKLLHALETEKAETLRLLITDDLSTEERAVIELAARLLAQGTLKAKRQAGVILKALLE